MPDWFLAKDMQFLQCEDALPHVTFAHGITWYTPNRQGPPTVAQLANHLRLAPLYCHLPLNIQGEHIPPPPGVSASDLHDERRRYNGD
jgi:hypothetical protein